MYYVNKNISHLFRTSETFSRKGYLRLDMNENPEGLPSAFVSSVLKKITPELLATYPEKQPLIRLLAQYYSIEPENIGLFNGSDEAIRLIFETFGKKGGQIVASDPTFAMYQVYAKMFDQEYVTISYDENFHLNFDKFLYAITEQTNFIFALNPNNPIGTVFSEEEMNQIVHKAHACNALVVVDEAYHYFYPNSFLNCLPKYDNIIILRTFSKLFSLAACRLGVAISNEKIIRLLNQASCSYNVNSIALLFGEELIRQQDMIQGLIKTQLEGKEFLISELRKKEYEVIAYEGNFVFIKPKHPVEELVTALMERNILVKSYSGGFLQYYIRVSTGSIPVMKTFIRNFLEIDQHQETGV